MAVPQPQSETILFFFSSVHHTYTRIDYIFVDNRLIPQVHSCTYPGIVISDHAPVVMSLILPDAPRPTRHWRLNPTLLSDPQFVKFIEEQIVFFFKLTAPQMSIFLWSGMRLRSKLFGGICRK